MIICGGIFDEELARKRIDELTALSESQEFWNDPVNAKLLMRERQKLVDATTTIHSLDKEASEGEELLALTDGDQALIDDIRSTLQVVLDQAITAETQSLLSGEADENDSYLQINAGEGGTESMDWALMLQRMYKRWAERRDFEVKTLDERKGEEAGIKSTTMSIKGENAYGWLKSEQGVHRLVRISPFDSSARRHTSFASVSVSPVIDQTINIEIDPSEVRTDTFRASGAGGQHINKTDSAVRLTHTPTGIVVSCQNDRSQHINKSNAWDMLRSRLYEIEIRKREEATKSQHDEKSTIGFGSQIRSYVLQPYQMVKDHRTQAESSNPLAVLDGDIDKLLSAYLSFGKIQN